MASAAKLARITVLCTPPPIIQQSFCVENHSACNLPVSMLTVNMESGAF